MALPLLGLLGGAGVIGRIAGGAGKGQAQERGNQNNAASDNYRTQQSAVMNLLGLRESATRDRADRAMSAPAQRSKQAIVAQMLANYQPRTVSGLPSGVSIPRTGGGRLAALMSSPQAKQSLEALTRTALEAQLSGSDVPEMPDTQGALVAPPQYRNAGKFESILSGMGLVGGAAGAVGELVEKLREQKTTRNTPGV